MTVEIDKFASAIKCRRILNARILPQDEAGFYHGNWARCTPWRESQVLFRTPEYTYVLHNALASDSLPIDLLTLATSARNFSLVPQFDSTLARTPERIGHVVIERWADPLLLVDLDRAVNVCQDLGRWDMAVSLILDLLGNPPFHPESIQWAGFPHHSRMAFVFGGRGYIPSGAVKQVLEYWWAAHGGYHARRIHTPSREDYDKFMASARNPWANVGCDPAVVGRALVPELLPVMHPRTPDPFDSRYTAARGGVGYRPDESGTERPWYYVNGGADDGGPRAWTPEFRDELVRYMRLPLWVSREVRK